MFCIVKRSKIWESEVQRANRIYCVRRAERSDSGVRVQRALRIFEKFIHIIPFLVGFLLLYLIFLFWKMEEGLGVNSIFQNSLLNLSSFCSVLMDLLMFSFWNYPCIFWCSFSAFRNWFNMMQFFSFWCIFDATRRLSSCFEKTSISRVVEHRSFPTSAVNLICICILLQ